MNNAAGKQECDLSSDYLQGSEVMVVAYIEPLKWDKFF